MSPATPASMGPFPGLSLPLLLPIPREASGAGAAQVPSVALLLAGVVGILFCCLVNSPWGALTILETTPAPDIPSSCPHQGICCEISRLNSPSSLILSPQDRCCKPVINLVAFSGLSPTGPCLFCAQTPELDAALQVGSHKSRGAEPPPSIC